MTDPISISLTSTGDQNCYAGVLVTTGAGTAFVDDAEQLIVSQAVAGEATRAGIQFEFPGLQFDTDGTILDAPVIASAVLSFDVVTSPGTAVQYRVDATLDARVQLYSLASPPGFVQTISLLPTGVGGIAPSFLTMPALTAGTFSTTLDPTALMTAMNHARSTGGRGWGGRLGIVVRSNEAEGVGVFTLASDLHPTLSPPTLALTYVPAFTGLVGGPGYATRAVRDGRFGMPAFVHELVRDGAEQGMWVRQRDWEPEAEDEMRYRPRPGEGSRRDRIPDL